MDECKRVRELVSEQKNIVTYVNILFEEIESAKLDNFRIVGAGHILWCKDCLNWITALVGESTVDKAKRAAKYCCNPMFRATEESEKSDRLNKVKVEFSLLRDADPCWRLNGAYIYFCPWCGHRLPDRKF